MEKLCVVIPTYNRLDYLKKTIKSIKDEGVENRHIYVFDDKSPDNTGHYIIKEYENINVKINTSNIGICKNIMQCLQVKGYEFILIFEDHDIMLKGYINTLLNGLEKYRNASVAISRMSYINQNGVEIGFSDNLFNGFIGYKKFLNYSLSNTGFYFPICGLIRASKIRGEAIEIAKKFNTYGDVYFWMYTINSNGIYISNKYLYQSMIREKDHILRNKHLNGLLEVKNIHRIFYAVYNPNFLIKIIFNLKLYYYILIYFYGILKNNREKL